MLRILSKYMNREYLNSLVIRFAQSESVEKEISQLALEYLEIFNYKNSNLMEKRNLSLKKRELEVKIRTRLEILEDLG